MDKDQKQPLTKAQNYIGSAQKLVEDTNYEGAAVYVTLAFKQVENEISAQPNIFIPNMMDFSDSLIEIDRAPGTDPADPEVWVGLTSEPFTREKVEGQIQFLEGIIHRLD
jgi:hypothetical protein